jgi:pyruvate-ferredoxin/flavodoxin oxidoreductase
MLDSKAPSKSYIDFIKGEIRYSSLTRTFPDIADKLFAIAEKDAKDRYKQLTRLADYYAP